MTLAFVHLRVHSAYSLANSVVRIDELIAKTADCGMPAIAITDQANIYAAVKFYKAAIQAGVKPVIGVDAWIENEQNLNTPSRLGLLVKNEKGYKNLCLLLARAHRDAQHTGRACIKKDWFTEHNEGLIVLSGAMHGELGQALLNATAQRAEHVIQRYRELFDDRFYIELHRVGQPREEEYIEGAVDLAVRSGLPVVATNDIHFLSPEQFQIHEIRVCIQDGRILSDQRRPKLYTEQQYFRSVEEMIDLFSDIPEAAANSVSVLIRV